MFAWLLRMLYTRNGWMLLDGQRRPPLCDALVSIVFNMTHRFLSVFFDSMWLEYP